MTSREDTNRIVDEAITAFDGLDILVHKAGIDITSPALAGETSDDWWDQVMAVHLTAGFRLFKRAVPALLKGQGPSVPDGSMCGVRSSYSFVHRSS